MGEWQDGQRRMRHELTRLTNVELQTCAAATLAALVDVGERWTRATEEYAAARQRLNETLTAVNAVAAESRRLNDEWQAIQAENGRRGAFVVVGKLPS